MGRTLVVSLVCVASLAACAKSSFTGPSKAARNSGATDAVPTPPIAVDVGQSVPGAPPGDHPKTCESADSGIAKVDPTTCVVTGVKPGTTTIKETGEDGTVKEVPVTVKSGDDYAVSVPVGDKKKVPHLADDGDKHCVSSDPSIAKVDADTCEVTGVKPGETTIKATGDDGSTTDVAVTVTPGDVGGDDSDADDDEAEAEVEDGVISGKVARIEITTTVDHDSNLVIEDHQIYWRHLLLGIPIDTAIKFYDASGKLLNDKDWVPEFEDGQGPNCHPGHRATLYCEEDTPCDCLSDKVKLKDGISLTGKVTTVSGRDKAQVTSQSPLTIQVQDHKAGYGTYKITIE